MNEFGEPNMGNPSVRFDEGRSGNVVLTTAVCSNRLFPTPPTLLNHTESKRFFYQGEFVLFMQTP